MSADGLAGTWLNGTGGGAQSEAGTACVSGRSDQVEMSAGLAESCW